ncbi:MAG: hypothetical protein U5R49_10085 [Deltaproteobacteria bacterium]|nr:hypothetical protein [Deltaproteobacteria bacterium]
MEETYGKLKGVEYRQFLEHLDEKGLIKLPARGEQYVTKGAAKVQRTEKGDIQPAICSQLKELLPIALTRVV